MSNLPAAQLLRSTLGRGPERKVLCMLSAYFDDSGTDGNSPVMVLGGLIGDEAQWDEFETRWSALLKHPLPGKPALSMWHSYDCNYSLEEFESYKPGERDAITHDFRKVIVECDLVSYAVCVDKSPWHGRFGDVIRYQLGLPSEIAMSAVIQFCHKMAGVSLVEPKIGVVFDAGWSNQCMTDWAKYYVEDDPVKDRISSVSFAKVVDQAGLQGADLIATEAFWFNKSWMKEGDNVEERPHFHDIRYGDLARGVVYRETEIMQMLNRALEASGEQPIRT